MTYSIAVIVGSLRQESFNKQLAQAAINAAPAELQLQLITIDQLPLYNQDLDQTLPQAVIDFKTAVAATDAALIVTPEYNRSIPGVLKNAIDWGSRPDKDNVWTGKPIGMMGASTGQFGTINAQFDLRKVFTHTNSLIMPQPQVMVTNVEKKLINGQFDEVTTKVITKYLVAFTTWIKRVK